MRNLLARGQVEQRDAFVEARGDEEPAVRVVERKALGPPSVTSRYFVLVVEGSNVSAKSAAVSSTPTLLEPNATTYGVAPSTDATRSMGVARLCSAVPAGAGSFE